MRRRLEAGVNPLQFLQISETFNKTAQTIDIQLFERLAQLLTKGYTYCNLLNLSLFIDELTETTEKIFSEPIVKDESVSSIVRQMATILSFDYKKEVTYVEIKTDLTQLIEEQIKGLKPLVEDLERYALPKEDPLATLISEINDQVKKGTRMNMKLFEELRGVLEEQGSSNYTDRTKEFDKERETYIQLIIKGIDSMDLIRNTAATSDKVDQSWTKQTEKLINEQLRRLEEIGIVEYPVQGKILDGEYMESIGVVEANDDVPQYTVVQVLERCFMNVKENKVIRFAKVLNKG